MKKTERTRIAVSVAVMAVSAVVVVIPLVLVLLNSFKPYSEIAENISALPKQLTLVNYQQAWRRLNYPIVFRNTVVIAIFSNIGSIVFAGMLGYWIVRHPCRFTRGAYLMIIAGMSVPFQGIMITFAKMAGVLHLTNHLYGAVISNWVFSMPMSMFLTAGAVKSVPFDIEESARIDGCGPLRIYWTIVFPLIKGTVFTVACLNIITYWNDYLMTQFLLTKKGLRTFQIAMQSLFNEAFFAWDTALAAISLAILPLFVFFLIAQRQVMDGVAAGAVKG